MKITVYSFKFFCVGVLAIGIAFGVPSAASASEADGHSATSIAPTKRALIKTLLESAETVNTTKRILNAMFLAMENAFPHEIAQRLEGMPQGKDREEARKKMTENAILNHQRMKEQFGKRINLPELVEQASYPVYDKYFTEGELRDMIAYNQSPTGKKAVTLQLTIMKESTQRAQELAASKFKDLAEELQRDEIRK